MTNADALKIEIAWNQVCARLSILASVQTPGEKLLLAIIESKVTKNNKR